MEQRSEDIRANILTVSEEALLDDPLTPQGQALAWLIEDDDRLLCPPDDLIQRWVMAVIYFSTEGDNWDQCSDAGIDLCGSQDPFLTKRRFLSSFNECQWAGISCNINSKVTEIEFEENNLIGTIPTEIGVSLRLLGCSLLCCMYTDNLLACAPCIVANRLGHLGDGTWWIDWPHSKSDWGMYLVVFVQCSFGLFLTVP